MTYMVNNRQYVAVDAQQGGARSKRCACGVYFRSKMMPGLMIGRRAFPVVPGFSLLSRQGTEAA
jgi:hypothetical protein